MDASNMDNNPYATPVDTQHGKYDHRLFWRIVKFVWAFILILIFIDGLCFLSYSTTSQARDASPAEMIRSLFLGWEKH